MAPSTKEPQARRLERERQRQREQIDRARIDAIVAAIAALPVVDRRAPEELIGYDEIGLPGQLSRTIGCSRSSCAAAAVSSA